MIVAVGIPWSSKNTPSCTLHVVQDPQSASASITTSVPRTISSRSGSGAGRAKVGFFLRTIALGFARSRSSSSMRSSSWSPFALEMSSSVITLPSSVDGRGAEHEECVAPVGHLVIHDDGHAGGNGGQEVGRRAASVIVHTERRVGSQHRHRALAALEAVLHVERLPGILLLPLTDAIGVAA